MVRCLGHGQTGFYVLPHLALDRGGTLSFAGMRGGFSVRVHVPTVGTGRAIFSCLWCSTFCVVLGEGVMVVRCGEEFLSVVRHLRGAEGGEGLVFSIMFIRVFIGRGFLHPEEGVATINVVRFKIAFCTRAFGIALSVINLCSIFIIYIRVMVIRTVLCVCTASFTDG